MSHSYDLLELSEILNIQVSSDELEASHIPGQLLLSFKTPDRLIFMYGRGYIYYISQTDTYVKHLYGSKDLLAN
jgi:hypothetical protein